MNGTTLIQSQTINVIRLSGRTLVVTRSLWLAICVTATLAFLVALPFRWAQLTHPSPTNLSHLNALGIAPTFYAAYMIFWEILIAAPYAIVGSIIFKRCGDERIALLTSLFLVVFGVGSGTFTPTILALLGIHPALDFLQQSFGALSWITFAWFFYLFPTGRFVPGWTRWLALLWTSHLHGMELPARFSVESAQLAIRVVLVGRWFLLGIMAFQPGLSLSASFK